MVTRWRPDSQMGVVAESRRVNGAYGRRSLYKSSRSGLLSRSSVADRDQVSGRCCQSLGTALEVGRDRHFQQGVMEPAAGVGSALPALEHQRPDMVSFFFIENFRECRGHAGTHLGHGTAEVQKSITAVVENRHGAPALRARVVDRRHGFDPPWSW